MNDCEKLKQRKEKCFAKNGERSEKCAVHKLQEKRCLSFRHCSSEATTYYGTLDGDKALCALSEEAFCFGNPRVMGVDSAKEKKTKVKVFEQHQRALRKVTGNRQRYLDCQEISKTLSKCLRQNM
jgi:hypothetical protein